MDVTNIFLVVFSGVVAVSTAVYAILTWRLVSETEGMRRTQTNPRIGAYVELDETTGRGQRMDLMIQNVGQGPAEDIRFRFEGDPTYFGEIRPIDQLSVIRNGLAYLGPNQGFKIVLGFLIGEDFSRAIQQPWIIHIECNNAFGHKMPVAKYVVDFSQFDGLIVSESPFSKMEKHLDALQKDVHHLSTGFHKLQVVTQIRPALDVNE